MMIQDLTLEHTDVYVGRKKGAMSIYLKNRVVVSVDARPWPCLEGLMVLELSDSVFEGLGRSNNTLTIPDPFAKVECILIHRNPLGALLETILYSESILLDPSAAIREYHKIKIPFLFDFGSQALPPSLRLSHDAGAGLLSPGIHWILTGYMLNKNACASRDISCENHTKRTHSSSMPFTLAYQHSLKSVGSSVPKPITGVLKNPFLSKLFLKSQKLSVCAGFMQPPLYEPRMPFLGKDTKHLNVKIDVQNLLPSKQVHQVQFKLKQVCIS